MDATTYDRRDEGWEPYAAPQDEEPLPRRPRREFFNKRSAALIAIVTCGVGFYAGVRIEKGQVGNPSAITLPTAASGAARSGATGARAGGSGLAALFGGGAAGGANSGTSFGTISGVKGSTLYVTGATGNVTKVRLSSATKISKSLGVKRSSLHPGDTVVIRGLKGSGGTLVAASVSDSGASAGGFAAAGGGGSSSGGSAGGGSSAVSSLFSSGSSGG
jgi:Domain of unknown function (DUF5666)